MKYFLSIGDPAISPSDTLEALGLIAFAALVGPLIIGGMFYFLNPENFKPEKFKK